MTDEESVAGSSDRWIHGLLSGLHDGSADARVRLVMREIDARRGRSTPRIAAVLLVGAGMLLGLLFQAALPDAHAILERASIRAEESCDRQYHVTVSLLRSAAPDLVSQGTMHVRGTRLYAYEFDGMFRKGWMGADGVTRWILPERGEPREWPVGDESRWSAQYELRYASIDTYVQNLEGRFDFSYVGREGNLLRLRATRKPGALSETVSQIDFWIAKETKLIMKSLSRLEVPRLRHPLLVSYDYLGDVPHPLEFYTLKGHSTASRDAKH